MKYALIIGNNKYDDQKLAQLKTPAADSQALAKILDDKTIGSFDEVTPLINQTEGRVRRAISTFLTNKKPDDLVLLYFSGHGVLDDRGRLYLALKDTQYDLLKATSIPSSFVADEMDSCRSKRQILILDCCHSGAFGRGTKGEQKAVTETTFEGSGFGRVVLTASDSTQYALEGDQVIKQTELSLFTHFLLEGLKTGEADVNNDGLIALDEWYDYTYGRVVAETPKQIPHKWSYNQQGDLIIAKNPHVKKRVVELPYELLQALESSFVGIRESAVNELGKYLQSRDPEVIALAVASLEKMKQDDSRRISSLADRLLSEYEKTHLSKKTTTGSTPQMELEPATIDTTNNNTLPEESKFTEARPAYPSIVEKTAPAVDKLIFFKTFLFKWSALVVLGIMLSILLYNYSLAGIVWFFAVPFGTVTGLTSLVQWWVFRDRLESWWISANLAAGALLGALYFAYYTSDAWGGYEHFWRFSIIWIIGNFIVGTILLWRTQAHSNDIESKRSAGSVTEWMKTDPRQVSFIRSLAVSLILFAIPAFLDVSRDFGFLSIRDAPDWLFNVFAITAVMASLWVGITLLRKKDARINFGLITLAIFAILNGIVLALLTINPALSPHFLTVPAIMSLVAGMFFVFQGETWKHLRTITLAGFLIFIFPIYFGIDDAIGRPVFSIITIGLALLSGIFFFLRK
jgi:uncharacterized caspase-like protein